MKILIVTPASRGSHRGNRITAIRWAAMIRSVGHRAVIAEEFRDESCDCLLALHARKSAPSVRRFRKLYPFRPLIVALTGTDLYADLPESRAAQRSLQLADRLIVLQPHGVGFLPDEARPKAVVIRQSATPPGKRPAPLKRVFELSLIGHLRPVKDPFRAALAARKLPAASRILVTHAGAALSKSMEERAERESLRNPRYRWIGDRTPSLAKRIIARSRAMVLTSKLEGGANVVSEAIVCGVPVLSSRISGSIGMLGEDYPGYFPVGDTDELAALMLRTEQDREFRQQLKRYIQSLQPLYRPAAERAAWRNLLAEIQSAHAQSRTG